MEDNRSDEQKRIDAQSKITNDFSIDFANIKVNNAIHVDDTNIDVVIEELKSRIDEVLEEIKYSNSLMRQRSFEMIEDAKTDLKRVANKTREEEFEEKYVNIIKTVSRGIDILYDDPGDEGVDQYIATTTSITEDTIDEATTNSINKNTQQNSDIFLNIRYDLLKSLNLDDLTEIDIRKAIDVAEEKLDEYYKENSDNMNRNLSDVVENIKNEVIEQCQKDYEFGMYSKERKESRKKLEDMFK